MLKCCPIIAKSQCWLFVPPSGQIRGKYIRICPHISVFALVFNFRYLRSGLKDYMSKHRCSIEPFEIFCQDAYWHCNSMKGQCNYFKQQFMQSPSFRVHSFETMFLKSNIVLFFKMFLFTWHAFHLILQFLHCNNNEYRCMPCHVTSQVMIHFTR
jgi:hypothetical protein